MGGLPCPFLKIEKRCPDLTKKCPDTGKMCPVCVHLWVKILIENVIWRAFWRKKTKIFPCRAFLLCVTHKTFIEVPLFQETSAAPKNSWLRVCNLYLLSIFSSIYTYLDMSICLGEANFWAKSILFSLSTISTLSS